MNRSSHSDHPEYNQSIYPMTRQELAVAPVSWTRLKARTKKSNANNESIRPHFADRCSSATDSRTKPDYKETDHNKKSSLLEEAETAANENRFTQAVSPGEAEVAAGRVQTQQIQQQDVEHRESPIPQKLPAAHSLNKQMARADQPEKSPVAKPKYLKHAVRFGGPSTKIDIDKAARHQKTVSEFQKQQQPIEVDNAQLRSLQAVDSRGVNSRGQVYSNGTNHARETEKQSVDVSSTAATLTSFLGEHHRSIQQMPIIQVTASKPAQNKSQIATAAKQQDTNSSSVAITTDSVYPYWLKAIVQIIIGTIIVILVMNLTHRLMSGTPQQLIERSTNQQTFPVQQANSEIPVDGSPSFIR